MTQQEENEKLYQDMFDFVMAQSKRAIVKKYLHAASNFVQVSKENAALRARCIELESKVAP